MHKMIRCDIKRIRRRYDRLIFLLNLPSMALAAAMLIIAYVIFPNMAIPDDLYKAFFLILYICCAYSFIVTLISSVITGLREKGHSKYTYIEILGQQMVVSEYRSSALIDGMICDYRKLWVIELSDVDSVVCLRNKTLIRGKARCLEQRADWLDYEYDEKGMIHFERWWFDDNGGEQVNSVGIIDVYKYIERVAQRIIFCSEKQKKRIIRREEFRQRMLEIAGRSRSERRKKPKKRVFRGYEPEMERKF